ncbi:ABC transporter permease [Natrialbaceae archaeon A-CW3]
MNTVIRLVGSRLLFALVVVWLLLTAMFAFLNWAPDPNETMAAWGAAVGGGDPQSAVDAYQTSRGLDTALHERYLDWMIGYVTFDWGWSHTYERPVSSVVFDATLVSAVYILPALFVSTVASTLLGYYSATASTKRLESAVRVGAYALAAIPAFFLAGAAFSYAIYEFGLGSLVYDTAASPLAPTNLKAYVVPAVVLSLTLFGVQSRYVRSQTAEYADQDFVKLARSKGLRESSVSRHILANAKYPLLSLSFAEVLSIFVLTIYVLEYIFTINGIGYVGYTAIDTRDGQLILGAMLVPVGIGLLGNLLIDLASELYDPRTDDSYAH